MMRWKVPKKATWEWHTWFAWYPVYGRGSGQWLWLETVLRRLDGPVWFYKPDPPVRANPQNIVKRPAPAVENQGSYPEEITKDQFDWLQKRAAALRKEWEEHARSCS